MIVSGLAPSHSSSLLNSQERQVNPETNYQGQEGTREEPESMASASTLHM